MIVYKVVREDDNGVSHSSSPAFEGWSLKYCIGKRTRAIPGSPGLFVFLSEEAAKRFSIKLDGRKVLECETINHPARVRRLYIPKGRISYVTYWVNALRNWGKQRPTRQRWDFPKGTHVVHSLTPLRFV